MFTFSSQTVHTFPKYLTTSRIFFVTACLAKYQNPGHALQTVAIKMTTEGYLYTEVQIRADLTCLLTSWNWSVFLPLFPSFITIFITIVPSSKICDMLAIYHNTGILLGLHSSCGSFCCCRFIPSSSKWKYTSYVCTNCWWHR